MSKQSVKNILFAITALVLIPQTAMAHTVFGMSSGFLHGLFHPYTGLDHILAMTAVGLWAAQLGGRALWAVPAAFVGAMIMGGAIGFSGVNLPFAEMGIVASMVVLGALITGAVKLSTAVSAVLVGAFAIFHGYAHGAEMNHGVSYLTYSIGFVVATASLHLLGILAAKGIQNHGMEKVVRLAGAAIALGGVYLAMS